MSIKTRWLLIILVAMAGHFMDGWSYPPHATVLGWWFWHAINWLRRDVVLVILLWPVIMHSWQGYEYMTARGWYEVKKWRFDLPERLALWILAALGNYLAHQILYLLGLNTRGILQ